MNKTADKIKVVIGIDSGVNTGFAIWGVSMKAFIGVVCTNILSAMEDILKLKNSDEYEIVSVVVEDARQVKYKTSKYKAQGAGSVKRDCQIWEDFLKRHDINHRFVRPNAKITKLNADVFKRTTGYQGKTNEHGRDAAMLVINTKGII